MTEASKAARNLLRRYQISKPSLENLCGAVTEQGYEIIDFNTQDESMSVLVKELALTPDILNQNAFVYQNNGVRLLFVKDNLTPQEKLYVIAHELGHIVLGHLQNGDRASVTEEYEADEFMHYLLHPRATTSISVAILRHRLLVGILTGAIMVGAIAGGIIGYISAQKAYTGDYYITPNGQKYHRANCSVIVNHANARRMTTEEYESGEYEPCKLCVPEN